MPRLIQAVLVPVIALVVACAALPAHAASRTRERMRASIRALRSTRTLGARAGGVPHVPTRDARALPRWPPLDLRPAAAAAAAAPDR